MLKEHGYDVRYTAIVPDEREQIKAELVKCADELRLSLVLTTGGTGFSSRDITPEATLEIVERRTPGIPEAMRAESLKITPRGCLSRAEAGIRGRTLIVNLPGSEKAAKENLEAVLEPIAHGVQMLLGSGSADCGVPIGHERHHHHGKKSPSMDEWLREAKKDPSAKRIGMYLTHNGVVRATARALAREGDTSAALVSGMAFSYDREKVEAAIADTYKLEASTMYACGSTKASSPWATTSCTSLSAATSARIRSMRCNILSDESNPSASRKTKRFKVRDFRP